MQIVVGTQLVAYEQYGSKKEQLVILHGWGARGEEWKTIALALASRYTVTCVDLPGFGNSSLPPESWGVDEYAAFVESFLQKIGIRKAVVLGHSFGGRIGILLAARKSVVTTLVLVDAAGVELKSKVVTMYQWILRTTPGQLAKYGVPKGIRDYFRSEDYVAAGKMKAVFRNVISEPLGALLPLVSVPTVIIWGEKDVVLSFAEARTIHSLIPGSILRVVWGASHWPHLERPDELLQILEEEHV